MIIRLKVVCAVTFNHEKKILAARRSTQMPLPLKWEFPGGKVEEGEQETDALRRELQEELDIQPVILDRLPPSVHTDAHRVLELIPYLCRYEQQRDVEPTEHEAVRWLGVDDLQTLDWAAADWPIVRYIEENWAGLLPALPANEKHAEQNQGRSD